MLEERNAMTIKIDEHDDGSFSISWDENDPDESLFNNWTKDDFIELFRKGPDQYFKEHGTD